ncbi:hypothetical protein JGH11_06705 [Dysgonomonas sp. Marseille-P4677]|uniref:hypothetical protein n=1 Tax=Dysgonomonas sp. Marseille-P4677 TaxID=2364790 RepID=UPI001911E637|nr:hypothetical protein [Dysgonomonas sp. Marseille-P4677]MBK5720557.1 hypothetical protein [Dysgonomonas sp. Marseille-P4677]
MKKYVFIAIFATLLLSACGAMKVADIGYLSQGMSYSEVNRIMGNPKRILSSDYTQDGLIEVFEYHTYQNDAYAIEFWDGRLSRYDFMYENNGPSTIVVPSPSRPRPDYVAPSRPSRPSEPSRPSGGGRPGTSTSRPETKPSESGRPSNVRPSTSSGRNPSSNIQKEEDKKTDNKVDKDKK